MANAARIALFVTALGLEREAVCAHLKDVTAKPGEQGTIYYRGAFDEGPTPWDVVVIEVGWGTEATASLTERAVGKFIPEVAVFVGIAGGLKDVKHGDVVASKHVSQYEAGKDTPEGFIPRPQQEPPDYALRERAKHECTGATWLTRIKAGTHASELATVDQSGKKYKAQLGPIVSGSKVLADTESELFLGVIKKVYGECLAVEMEGYGFLKAINHGTGVKAIVVRGISDLVGDKNSRDDELWQPIAARNAAAFAFHLLATFELPGDPTAATAMERLDRLTRMRAESDARCSQRWLAAGVDSSTAAQLTQDDSVGAPAPEETPSSEQRFRLLTGEVGAGKSLRLERWHQQRISDALTNPAAPLPVYVEARSDVDIGREIENQTKGLGDWRKLGVALAIDRLERAGTAGGEELLAQVQRIVLADKVSTAVISARPFLRFPPPGTVAVTPLQEHAAQQLMSRVAGRPVGPATVSSWPKTFQDAVRRPLFAILCGLELAAGRPGGAIVPLIRRLIERAIHSIPDVDPKVLSRLASLSVDRGYSAIRTSDLGSSSAVAPLLHSTLVSVRGDSVAFVLDVFTDWYAAQSLIDGSVRTEDLCRDLVRLDRWRYPLSIAVASADHDRVTAILKPIAGECPAFASRIVHDSVDSYATPGQLLGSPHPPTEVCSSQIRESMTAWIAGLPRATAQIIAPVDDKGALFSLAVTESDGWITAAWGVSAASLPPVIPVLGSAEQTYSVAWGGFRSARPADSSAWSWSWTLDELGSGLEKAIKDRAFPFVSAGLLAEEVWHQALVAMGKGRGWDQPFDVATVEATIAKYGPNYGLRHNDRIYDFAELHHACADLRSKGIARLVPPWPGPDGQPGRYWWSGYSATRFEDRSKAIFHAALDGYSAMVETFFPKFAPHLRLASLMPVRVIATYPETEPGESECSLGPRLNWYCEPCDKACANDVAVSHGEPPDAEQVNDLARSLLKAVSVRRPHGGADSGVQFHYGVAPLFSATPATDLVYEWLKEDLKAAKWIR